MTKHVHIGFVPMLIAGCYVIMWLFILRWIAASYPDSAIGKAAAAIN